MSEAPLDKDKATTQRLVAMCRVPSEALKAARARALDVVPRKTFDVLTGNSAASAPSNHFDARMSLTIKHMPSYPPDKSRGNLHGPLPAVAPERAFKMKGA